MPQSVSIASSDREVESRRGVGHLFALVLVASAAIVIATTLLACVGEDAGTSPNLAGSGAPPAAQTDASASANATTDGSAADVSDSAAPPRCDPAKPFGSPTPVLGLDVEGIPIGSAVFSSDELTAFVSASNPDAGVKYQLYTTSRPKADAPFGGFVPLDSLNGSEDDRGISIAGDGLSAVFYSTRPGVGADDLWITTKATAAGAFGPPELIANVNTSERETNPWLSADGLSLLFTAYRGADRLILQARRSKTTEPFGVPASIAELNASPMNSMPVLSKDGRTLYLNRADDVWVTTRVDTSSPWVTPTPVAVVNTANIEGPVFISDDGCRLYFRRAVVGLNYRIWSAVRPL